MPQFIMRSLAKSTTAAAATTGALFALQQHTEAAVIYSGMQNVSLSVSHSLGTIQPVTQPLGLDDLRFVLARTTGFFQASIRGSGDGFLVNNTASHALAKLAAGQLVSAGKAFYSGAPHGVFSSRGNGPKKGTWAPSDIGFAGVKLSNGSLGWIRLKWTDMDNTQTLIALDWAYNETPGISIRTGDGILVAAPEPSRSLLALASLGSAALRRRRKLKVESVE